MYKEINNELDIHTMSMRWILLSLMACIWIVKIYPQGENPDRYMDAYKKYENADCPLQEDDIKHFVYFARDREAIHDHLFLKAQRISGAQIMYSWRQLEPEIDTYDFSIVQDDYDYLQTHGKSLFIQFQDVTFYTKHKAVPDYLLNKEFDGGATPQYDDNGNPDGWVAKRWNAQVQHRFHLLMQALGKQFDGKIEGINLQESAIGVSSEKDPTFTPERYLESLKINMLALKEAFPKSTTMQYANFMPGEWLPEEDKGFLRSIYQYGQEMGVGLGAPDLMVQRRGQLNHALAMMHEFDYTVPLGIAIQDGNYIGKTGADEDYRKQEDIGVKKRENMVPMLQAFAKDFLHVNYMFWVYQEPYFTEDVLPCLKI